ncbi:N-acetylglucosamine kinase [Streptomyces sp. NPDC057137]|uniref:N-acetylglucosamine kinase n=1 Tax=Streptomyces sp. NPDC057137 TaxID=3346030 RepID=UPI0036448E92
MAGLLVGVDVGGTKTHLRAVTRASAGAAPEVIHDVIVPSDGWSATPVDMAARWLVERLVDVLGAAVPEIAAVAVGAQGCEDREHCARLGGALRARLGVPVTVVNDAELLLPAAGFGRGTGIVVGTGSIGVSSDGEGNTLRAGGWGWVLSDDGSASALVREAARAVLVRVDRGHGPGVLGRHLLASVRAPDIEALVLRLSWGDGPEHWGRHAPCVVAAAEAGSEEARTVLDDGARGICDLVTTLADRGAPVHDLVFAGGLVTQVPSYWQAIRHGLTVRLPDSRPVLLTEPPVVGALALAGAAAGSARPDQR